jgi:putative transposase
MKKSELLCSPGQRWAEFRFGVVGSLLSDPPAKGELHGRLQKLAETSWTHPVTEEKFRLGLSTVERWYYASLNHDQDPLGALRRKVRGDSGISRLLSSDVKSWLQTNYRAHPSWSGQLHCDNLKVWREQNPTVGAMPSYPSVIRYMRALHRAGWRRRKGSKTEK